MIALKQPLTIKFIIQTRDNFRTGRNCNNYTRTTGGYLGSPGQTETYDHAKVKQERKKKENKNFLSGKESNMK